MSILFPAIDIREGKCVRLLQGDYDRQTVYGHDPLAMAKSFLDAGANHIHVVDLDGARDGTGKNIGVIESIAALGAFVQTGGGIRTMADVRRRMEAGVSRCIIGTAAVEDPGFVRSACAAYPGSIAVGIDERNGSVAVRGWGEESSVGVLELAQRMKTFGVDTVIHTDITRDGTKMGANVEKSARLMEQTGMNIVVSGGVSSVEDILLSCRRNLYGIIVGKALYDGEIDLRKILRINGIE